MLLVTGATGFIGSHLAERLIAAGQTVRCLVRRTSNRRYLDGLSVDCVEGDLTEADTWPQARWRRLLDGVEAVFHVAGVTKARRRRDFWQGNAQATRHLLAGCLRHGRRLRRFVYVSSIAATGPGRPGQPVDEETVPAPVTTYGRSKLAAERAVQAVRDRLPVTVVRPPVVYGPRDRDVLAVFRTIDWGLLPLVGGKSRWTSVIHCDDLVTALVLAWQDPRAEGQTFFATHEEPVEWTDVSRLAARLMGRRLRPLRVPPAVAFALGQASQWMSLLTCRPPLLTPEKITEMVQDYWVCDGRKAQQILGFRAQVGLEEGVRSTLAWYRRQGWL